MKRFRILAMLMAILLVISMPGIYAWADDAVDETTHVENHVDQDAGKRDKPGHDSHGENNEKKESAVEEINAGTNAKEETSSEGTASAGKPATEDSSASSIDDTSEETSTIVGSVSTEGDSANVGTTEPENTTTGAGTTEPENTTTNDSTTTPDNTAPNVGITTPGTSEGSDGSATTGGKDDSDKVTNPGDETGNESIGEGETESGNTGESDEDGNNDGGNHQSDNSGKKDDRNDNDDDVTTEKPKKKLVDDTLLYAINDKQTDDKHFVVYAEAICDRYGVEDVKIGYISVTDIRKKPHISIDYEIIEPQDGSIHIKRSGKATPLSFVCVLDESEKTVLWAGKFLGGEKDVPYAALYYEIGDAEQIPGIEINEGGETERAKLYVDLSEVVAEYGCEYSVHVSRGVIGNGYAEAAKVAEAEGIFEFDIHKGDDSCYVLICMKYDETESWVNIWAGMVGDLDPVGINCLVFHEYPELEFDVDDHESGEFKIAFKGEDSGKEDVCKDIEAEYTVVNEKGKEIDSDEFKITDDGIIVELDRKAAAYSIIMVRGNRIFHAQSINVKPIDPDSYKLRLSINERTVHPIDGVVSFTGTVMAASGELDTEEIEVYIDGGICDAAMIAALEDGSCSFAVTDYQVTENTTSITVYVQLKKHTGIYSDDLTINVGDPVLPVVIEGYTGQYDGKMHTLTIDDEYSDVFEFADAIDGEWTKEIPAGRSDVGETKVYVRAARRGFVVELYDAKGNKIEMNNGCAEVIIEVLPVEVDVTVAARQTGEVVYNGDEQYVPYEIYVVDVADPSGVFDEAILVESDVWKNINNGSLSGTDAGEYAVEFDKAALEPAKKLYEPNYHVEFHWQDSKVKIAQRTVYLGYKSQFAVYDAKSNGLPSHEPEMTFDSNDFVAGEYFRADYAPIGAQKDVGICAIGVKVNEKFINQQGMNYNLDYETEAGIYVVFPQSIAEFDAETGEVVPTADQLPDASDPEIVAAYRSMPADQLEGYYAGMRVYLAKTSAVYTGDAHVLTINFSNANGKQELVEGIDYVVSYYRGEELTDDFVNAGTINVHIDGKGNYTGTVVCEYVIVPAKVADTSVGIENWVFDGYAAGSLEHPVEAAIRPTEIIYYDAEGVEIEAPSEPGKYSMKACWSENYEETESAQVDFEIMPAMAIVEETSDETIVAELVMPGWVYDGKSAGSEEHKPTINGVEETVAYSYYGAAGEQIDPPVDAGTYRIVAEWGDEDSAKAECEFVIAPMAVTVCAENVEIIFGDTEPELAAIVAQELPDDEMPVFEIIRTPGNDVGTYEITLSGETEQGNYVVTYEHSTIVIKPRSIIGADVEFEGEVMSVVLGDNELAADIDYSVVVDENSNAVVISGIGNYCESFVVDLPMADETSEPNAADSQHSEDTDNQVETECDIFGVTVEKKLMVVVAGASASAALLCGIFWITLSRKIRKERYKLLDAVSRQSTRTIRENAD